MSARFTTLGFHGRDAPPPSNMQAAVSTPDSAVHTEPIFIMGIMPRCGTHFLASLLGLHPACTASALAEDCLLSHASKLVNYSVWLEQEWTRIMGAGHAGDPALLRQCLGEGLATFLTRLKQRSVEARAQQFQIPTAVTATARRLVSKTPQVLNLNLFFDFFPRASLLILIRDGPAVVESNARSFGIDPEAAMRTWNQGARTILAFDRDPASRGRKYRIMRYEELHRDPSLQMRELLPFLELDMASYDFARAEQVPVIGSSTFKRDGGKVRWVPVAKTADFNPLARADGWSRAQHERFNWLAGDSARALGYTLKTFPEEPEEWRLWNQAMDLEWERGRRLSEAFAQCPEVSG